MTTNDLTHKAEKLKGEILKTIQAYGFWCVVLVGIGVYGGITFCNRVMIQDTKRSILVGAFVFENVVYDITKREQIKNKEIIK